jgi:DNA-binding FrmR family transcriptional regulator
MFRPKNTQDRILHRYQISLGHLKKVVEMTKEDQYCIDILHQSQALRKALEETENLIMENHLQTCVVDDIRTGKGEKAVKEVMSVISHRN